MSDERTPPPADGSNPKRPRLSDEPGRSDRPHASTSIQALLSAQGEERRTLPLPSHPVRLPSLESITGSPGARTLPPLEPRTRAGMSPSGQEPPYISPLDTSSSRGTQYSFYTARSSNTNASISSIINREPVPRTAPSPQRPEPRPTLPRLSTAPLQSFSTPPEHVVGLRNRPLSGRPREMFTLQTTARESPTLPLTGPENSNRPLTRELSRSPYSQPSHWRTAAEPSTSL